MDAAKVIRGEMEFDELIYKVDEEKGIMGSYATRPNAFDKFCGTFDYGADLGLKLPKETLWVEMVQAEVSHAKILNVDYSKAEKIQSRFWKRLHMLRKTIFIPHVSLTLSWSRM